MDANFNFTLPEVSAFHLRLSAVEVFWFVVAHIRPPIRVYRGFLFVSIRGYGWLSS
jgi:hypothetical protein